MALIKLLETECGVLAEYHNVNVFKNVADSYLEITVNSYINSSTRREGKAPVMRESMLVPSDFWRDKAESLKIEEAAYKYLLSLDKFKDALSDEL